MKQPQARHHKGAAVVRPSQTEHHLRRRAAVRVVVLHVGCRAEMERVLLAAAAAMVVHGDGGWWIGWIGIREEFLGSSENIAGKLFWQRRVAGDGGGRWRRCGVTGGSRRLAGGCWWGEGERELDGGWPEMVVAAGGGVVVTVGSRRLLVGMETVWHNDETNKNLIDINIDALYKILKQNQGDVNEAMGHKKKAVVVTLDPLALVAENTKVTKRREKVIVQSESEGSDDEDISDLKRITTLLAKAFNRKNYYAKPTNNNLRSSSASSSANKKPEYVKSEEKKDDKKVNDNKRDMSKVKCYNCKKEWHFAQECKKAKDQAWMESGSDSDQEINANMVFMAKIEKVLSDSEESSLSVEETIAEIIHVCLWIIDSGCSKHMTSNRALLTNFVKKFLGTVCFSNNDFAVIAGYGDVVIRSMTIKKVYYVKGLGHNLFSVGQFCDKGLKFAFQKSTCFVRNEDGVDLLTGDRSSNLYTIALNKIASNSSACLLAKASSSQSWLWHQRISHLNFATINNLMKSNLVQDEASEVIILFIKKTQVNLQLQVQRIRTNNGTEYKNKTLAKFFDEAEAIATACFTQNRSLIHKHFDKTPYKLINKRKPNIKFFHVFGCICYLLNDYDDVGKLKEKGDIGVFVGYSKESVAFRESSSSSLNDDVQQNLEEVMVPLTNTQSVLNESVSNVNEASTSHNVFSERLEDAYFDASTTFYDPSNVHTFYQPYPYEKMWTKDHPLNCIEPGNVAEALKDADWVSAMQDELDQFARLKVWRLVP
nr:integrase, catalytic region, zinc finger, CCHC-type, peptidase aspartic, catalytic [Tanacetum cinerariifolium]